MPSSPQQLAANGCTFAGLNANTLRVVTVSFELEWNSDITLSLIDLSGKTIWEVSLSFPAGNQTLTFDIKGTAPGLYVLEARSDRMVARTKLLVR
ncbi:MAG: T9SS type A sorting domain-containing protein [Bacteroidia bacterium]|nr:T9SS type A sorting domain-containing protein [Bacteroidia bacterium]